MLADPTLWTDPGFHLRWLHVWLPSTGLLAMGLGDLLGGDEDDEDSGSGVAGDDDFLDGGGFEDDLEADADGFDGGLDEEEDDPLAEVEPRLSGLEAEIEDLSVTVSSIHGEHESMRESVDDIEANVRKLLEVYEVVTQGANPFADAPPAAPSGGEGFGLLDGDGGSETDASDDVGDLFDDVDDEEAADESPTEGSAESDEPSAGLSFDELKSEVEFDRKVGDDDGNEAVPPDDELADLDLDGTDDAEPPEPDRPSTVGPEKPYLTELPGGYGAELLVMEWLDYLVSESSISEAIRALRYYRTVDWISDDVASHLQSVLSGATPPRELATPDGGLPAELSVEHHSQSLEFVSRLSALGGSNPIGSPDGTLDGLGLGRRDHGVQR